MQIPHYELALDINLKEYRGAALIVRKGDAKSRYLDITLYAGNEQIVLNKERVTLTVADENSTFALTDCTIANGVITAELTAAMLAKNGTISCELTVYGTTSGQVVTAVRFAVEVVDTLSTEVIERTTNFSALKTALSDVASTSNRIDQVSNRTQPISLGGTGATNAKEAVEALGALSLDISTSVPENANLDEYLTIGSFEVLNSVIQTLSGSIPFTGHSFKLIVFATGRSYYKSQMAISPSTGEICIRDYDSTSKKWNAWHKIVSQPITTDEVGTFTPVLDNDSAGSISVGSARYTYDGNSCTVIIRLTTDSDVTSNTINLTGLPIAPKHDSALTVYIAYTGECVSGYVAASGKKITIRSSSALTSKLMFVTATYLV